MRWLLFPQNLSELWGWARSRAGLREWSRSPSLMSSPLHVWILEHPPQMDKRLQGVRLWGWGRGHPAEGSDSPERGTDVVQVPVQQFLDTWNDLCIQKVGVTLSAAGLWSFFFWFSTGVWTQGGRHCTAWAMLPALSVSCFAWEKINFITWQWLNVHCTVSPALGLQTNSGVTTTESYSINRNPWCSEWQVLLRVMKKGGVGMKAAILIAQPVRVSLRSGHLSRPEWN
jgi:hypothetical protein